MSLSVRDLRALAGLTQIQLARVSGVERSRLSLFECGHVELPSEQLKAVNHALRAAIRARVKRYEHALRAEIA